MDRLVWRPLRVRKKGACSPSSPTLYGDEPIFHVGPQIVCFEPTNGLDIIMAIQYLVFLTLLCTHVAALPILVDRATSDAQLLSSTTTRRTLFNITWNCVSTTIICAWVSVHPNVPPSGQWRALSRRLKMMFWTIVAPELILAWAVRQWFAAWEIRDTVNGTREGVIIFLYCQ